MKDLLNTFLNKEVVAIDAKGINHKGKLVGLVLLIQTMLLL